MADVKKTAGNKQTEVIIGTAALKLDAGVSALQAAVAAAQALPAQIENDTLKLQDLQAKIQDSTQELKNTQAQNKLELELQYKTDEAGFAQQYLETNGLQSVNKDVYKALNEDLVKTKTEMAQAISAEVGKAKGMLQNDYENKLKISGLEAAASQAQQKAQLEQKDAEIIFLKEQVASWKGALDAERSAGVERAKASSIGTLNVGQVGK